MVTDSYKQFYLKTKTALATITDEADFEARQLICHLLDINHSTLLSDMQIPKSADSDTKCAAITLAVNERITGRPLQYILGEWEFYGRRFFVGDGVLIPRADTEVLIEAILEYANCHRDRNTPLRILDICTGSGCIAVTLKSELTTADVWAIEKSDIAFEYAEKNAKLNGADMSLIKADALTLDVSQWSGFFDIIVSNPPYLTTSDMNNLQKEVSFEPQIALDGGEDGLFFYRELTAYYRSCLKKGGILCYEIGLGQEQDVSEIMLNNRLGSYCFLKDICGIIRVVQGTD